MTATETKPFWRTDPPELDDNGKVVKGGMWPHQRRWWEMPNRIRAIVTGYGGGKTLSICKREVALALLNGPAPSVIVSPTFPMARMTVIPTMLDVLQGKESATPGFRWDYNKTTHTFFLAMRTKDGLHRGTIHVLSGDNPLRLKGSNIGSASIDEPFIQDEEVFRQIVARLRHPAAKRREINLAGTPESLNWGFQLIDGDEDFGKFDVGLVTASTMDNKALDQDYIDDLEGAYDDTTAQAYIHGQFVNLSKGRVYHAFDPDRNVAELDVPAGAEWGAGMDFNVNPMAFLVFWRDGDHVHIVAEFEQPNSDTEDACQILVDKGYGKLGLRNIYPDPTGKNRSTKAPGGKSDFHYIRQAGFSAHATRESPKRRDRFNAVNGKLKHGTLTISPKCKKLRRYMLGYTHELANTETHKAMSHLLDAMGYPVVYLFPPVSRRAHSQQVA